MAYGISVWIPVITALAGIGGALGSQYISHRFTLNREKKASEDKMLRERYFIATELVIELELFAVDCMRVANDYGYTDENKQRNFRVKTPCIDFSAISGDWRTLPSMLMYRIRELALQQNNVEHTIARHLDPKGVVEKMEAVIFDVFKQRQYQYTRLGVKAMIQARRLRKLVNLPVSQFDNLGWATESVLWRAWRKNRADEVTRHREDTAEAAKSLTIKKVTKENE